MSWTEESVDAQMCHGWNVQRIDSWTVLNKGFPIWVQRGIEVALCWETSPGQLVADQDWTRASSHQSAHPGYFGIYGVSGYRYIVKNRYAGQDRMPCQNTPPNTINITVAIPIFTDEELCDCGNPKCTWTGHPIHCRKEM